jgi:hypothetical protein
LAKVTVTLATNASVNVIRFTGLQAQTNGMLVQWVGGQPPYTLYYLATNLTTTTPPVPKIVGLPPDTGPGPNWTPVGPAQPGETEAVVPATNASGFFRVKGGGNE